MIPLSETELQTGAFDSAKSAKEICQRETEKKRKMTAAKKKNDEGAVINIGETKKSHS